MLLSELKRMIILMVTVLILASYVHAAALNFEMDLVVSIPNPNAPGEVLTTQVRVGTDDRATDRFDTAWDVVAIPGGTIQAFLEHPESLQEVGALWRDTRASTSLPKFWDLKIQPFLSNTSVTLAWTLKNPAALPSSVRLRLKEVDANQEVDMAAMSTHTYAHGDAAQAHHFQIVLEEIPIIEPPPDPIPPDPEPPAVELQILTDSLPEAYLRKQYRTRLEAQGGKAPYHWQIISGGLPTGLDLNAATGVISGKPRRFGRYHFTIRVKDTENRTDLQDFTLSILIRKPHSAR